MQLRLNPPELGAVRLELRVQGTALMARLEAETSAARKTGTRKPLRSPRRAAERRACARRAARACSSLQRWLIVRCHG